MKLDPEVELYLKQKLREAASNFCTGTYLHIYKAYKTEDKYTLWCVAKAREHSMLKACLEILNSDKGKNIKPQHLWKIAVEVNPDLPKSPYHFRDNILPVITQHDITKYTLSVVESSNQHKNALKCSQEHVNLIAKFYTEHELATAVDVYRFLQPLFNDELAPISHSTVKNIIRKNKLRWDYIKYRELGQQHEKKAVLVAPSNPLTQVQIDGTTLAYPYLDELTGEINQIVIFIVLDVYSKKIIGWSPGLSENINTVMKALEMAFRVEGLRMGHPGILPGEIRSDNGSSFSHARFKVFQELCEKYGQTEFTKQRVGRPTGKSEVEFAIKRVQEMLKFDPGYHGLTAKAKSRTSRRGDKSIVESRKRAKLPNLNYIIGRVGWAVDTYNALSVSGKPSPNELFDNPSKPHATPLDLIQMTNLFWHRAKARVKPSAQFSFIYDKVKFYCEINLDEYTKHIEKKPAKGLGRGYTDIIVRFDYQSKDSGLGTVYCYDAKNTTVFLFKATEQAKQRKAAKERTLLDKQLSDGLFEENHKVANGYREVREDLNNKSLNLSVSYMDGKSQLKNAQDSILRSQFAERYKDNSIAVESQTLQHGDDATVNGKINPKNYSKIKRVLK